MSVQEDEEELQSLSTHQHYTSSGVRSILHLQGGSAGLNLAPASLDYQLLEEEEDGASRHQPSSTDAAPSTSMASSLLSVTSLDAQGKDNA